MIDALRDWIVEAQTSDSAEGFGLDIIHLEFEYAQRRDQELYFSLIASLFDSLETPPEDDRVWATLGNALAIVSRRLPDAGRADALFLSAVAFYSGGFSASAYLTLNQLDRGALTIPRSRACYDLLTRARVAKSSRVRDLLATLRSGSVKDILARVAKAEEDAESHFARGPIAWVGRYLYFCLLRRFALTNVRSILLQVEAIDWEPLIDSFTHRRPAVWDFFPSQIAAINSGLLQEEKTFSLQMPTGSGKTALMETLIYARQRSHETQMSVLLVPFRALARELAHSLGASLTALGLSVRTIYGGASRRREAEDNFDSIDVLISTPESFHALVSVEPGLLHRVSMVVCDEGHLLDSSSRGVVLELLLTRLRLQPRVPKIVFLSAVVPNIEEINDWLGGDDSSVVRSLFRASTPEYAVLKVVGSGVKKQINLELQETGTALTAHTLPSFVAPHSLQYVNPATRQVKTYKTDTKKSRAVLAARRALSLGAVAIYATTKAGRQGADALMKELLDQLDDGFDLPNPSDYVGDAVRLNEAAECLRVEYGQDWIGCRALFNGAVLHHGDIPQETRTVLEELLMDEVSSFVVCTGTLAEGVNLPIRTMVLYSITRREKDSTVTMRVRDIQNLVGRAGRPGSSTRGLIICTSPDQWLHVGAVARGDEGERLTGSLSQLVMDLYHDIVLNGVALSNEILQNDGRFHALVDSVDQALIELVAEESEPGDLATFADSFAEASFASRQLPADAARVLRDVTTLRLQALEDLRSSGRLEWFRELGLQPRLLVSVEQDLIARVRNWDSISAPNDSHLLDSLCDWAWTRPEYIHAINSAFRSEGVSHRTEVTTLLSSWLEGKSFIEIASGAGMPIDECLRVHSGVITGALALLVDQAMPIVLRLLVDQGQTASETVGYLSEFLRRGVSNPAALILLDEGLRHRRAAQILSTHADLARYESTSDLWALAQLAIQKPMPALAALGSLILKRTLADLT